MTEYRFKKAPAVQGLRAWFGQWRRAPGKPWKTASSQYGRIAYASKEAAVEGARVSAESESLGTASKA